MSLRFLLLPILLLPSVSRAQVPALRDSFDAYAPESDAAPAWASEGITFSVRGAGGSKFLEAEGPDGRSWLDWKAAPFVNRGVFSARFTPQKATGTTGWRVTGVGLKRDDSHFWHLALVQPPQGQPEPTARFVELSEMWGETWNAQGEPGTRVPVLEQSPDFAWEYGKSYRLEIALEERGGKPAIRGEVFEAQGAGEVSRWKRVHALQSEDGQGNAVTVGRPALTSGGLQVLIDDAALSSARAVAAPPGADAKPVFAPFRGVSLPNAPQNLPAKKASGFFGVGQAGGKWWLFDPAGKATLGVGTDHVNYNVHFSQAMGYAPYNRAVKAKFGSEEAWAKSASERLKAWNFNVLGTNSSPSVRYRNQAHFEFLSFGQEMSSAAALVEKTTWTGFPDVFDPRWQRLCERRAKLLCAPRRDDPWIIGYFLDNELEWWGKDWWDKPWGMATQTAKMPAASHGKRALLQVLEKAYAGDIAAFNADFGRDLKTWGAFLAANELGTPTTPKAKAAINTWLDEVARKYFEVTTAAVRKNDPNHLIWSCRFAGNAPDVAWKWAGKTCDVVTVNIYPRVDFATLNAPELDAMLQRAWTLGKRPVAVTEWSFPALDAVDSQGKPLPSKHGAGMRVDTQAQKAQAWAVMQSILFRTPFVVGSNYFMWTDEPAAGIADTFPEDSNYGLVSESDAPYAELTRVARAINSRALQIHASGIGTPPRLWQPRPQVLAAIPNASLVTESVNGQRFIRNGALAIEVTPGGPVQVLAAEGEKRIPLGTYRPLLHQVVGGQNLWTPADKITAVRDVMRADGKIEIDVDFQTSGAAAITEVNPQSGASEAQKSGAPPFQATVRIAMEPGKPYFLARAVSVKSLSPQPWSWSEFFHYVPSCIGGDAKDDGLGGPDVPNYWMSAGAWSDPSGWAIGVFAPRDDERLNVNFWRDEAGSQHPDARRMLGRALEMRPGQAWDAPADEPGLAVFGMRATAANPRPWGDLALAMRLAPQK